MKEAPENSLEAFRNALAKGVRALESDVWLDDTGAPVLHHDAAHLADLSLADLFRECGTDFDLSLDLKSPGAAEATLVVAREAGFDLLRLWLCGGRGSCAGWRALDPQVKLVTDLRWRDALFAAPSALAQIAGQGIDAVNLRHLRWRKGLVRHAHDAGLLAFAWDVQQRWVLRWVLRCGVDGVFSDHPRLLVDPLGQK